MGFWSLARAFVVLAALALFLTLTPKTSRDDLPRAAARLTQAPALRVLEGEVARHATLAELLESSLPPSDIHALVQVARPVYDLARISVGRPYQVSLSPDGLFHAFSYGIDELRTLKITRQDGSLVPEIVARDYERKTQLVTGEIESSLFAAVTDTGESDQLALDLAEIFAWDIDFNTEIQRGDSFRVVVENLSLDGRFVRYGPIRSAEFNRGSKVVRAVRFPGDHATGYYTPDGTPLRKAFLRSPLRFTRISSRFTRARLHPVLKIVRPHLAVDYAAPVGTPVSAAASGVVAFAGWLGGYGKTVRLRHPNGYETLYGHLSRISVRARQRVQQGDRIGAVGATGLATGPHLDYRMTRNGVAVDPLRIKALPAEPLSASERRRFDPLCREELGRLWAEPFTQTASASQP